MAVDKQLWEVDSWAMAADKLLWEVDKQPSELHRSFWAAVQAVWVDSSDRGVALVLGVAVEVGRVLAVEAEQA